MTDNKNLLLAIILSAAVLFGWSMLAERFFPTPAPAPTAAKAPAASATATSGAPSAQARVPVEAAVAQGPRVQIRTPVLSGSINLAGARIDDLVLTRYRQTVKKDSPDIRLFSPSNAAGGGYFAGFGFFEGPGAPPPDAVWTASGTELAPGKPVTLSWTNAQAQTFQIILSVNRDYLFDVTHRIINRGNQAAVARPFGLVTRVGESPDPDFFAAHVGPVAVFANSLNQPNWSDVTDAAGQGLRYAATGGWLGFSDKYWLAALLADPEASVEASFRHGAGNRFQADMARAALIAAPGATVEAKSRFFAGAKEVEVLRGIKRDLGIQRFDDAIDWGWFWFIAKPMFDVLHFLFKLVGNFGVAIMLLTLVVRLLLFPVANKQYVSMNKMKELAPRLKDMQERYKGDPQGLQQAMMKLYQTEKVNPLAGCLPILLQIPIFFALYKVLLLSIEMRHQPFALWIKDLSAPDPLTPVNLFGLLPFTPPAFIAIGVLPIILGVTMWLQQRLNPAPLDPIQAKVFSIMPWLFMVLMAPFAAGLQLYWATNNVLSIAQQWWLTKRHPATPKPAQAK
ncbi:MAG: membrane protein insertase YidC [Sphingomonadaceae bacterium]